MKKIQKGLLLVLMICSMFTMALSVTAAAKSEIRTENGQSYYYKDGKKVLNQLGVKVGKKYYRVDKSGVATLVSNAEGMAGVYAEKNGRDLKKCFMAIAQMRYRAVPAKSAEELACYGFSANAGDCNVQAYCVYYVAKVLGNKNVACMKGFVPTAKNSDGSIKTFGAHAWVTIKSGKTTYVYDPSLAQHYYLAKQKSKMKLAYKFKYGAKGTYQYYNTQKQILK